MTKKEQFVNMTPDQRRAWNRGYRRLVKGRKLMDRLDTRIYLGELALSCPVTHWRQVKNDAQKLIWVNHTVGESIICGFEIPSGSRVLLASGLTPEDLHTSVYGEIVAGKGGIRIHAWPLRTMVVRRRERPVMPPIVPSTKPPELPTEFCSDPMSSEQLLRP